MTKPATPLTLMLMLASLLVAPGCDRDEEVDYCAAQPDPTVVLGQGVGGG